MKKRHIGLVVLTVVLVSVGGFVILNPDHPVVDGFSDRIASNSYQGDKPLGIQNNINESVVVNISVVRLSTNETVHRESYRLEQNENRTNVYNLAPDASGNIEEYSITATIRGQSGSVTIKTNKCYGGVNVQIQSDGGPLIYHGICSID